MNKIIILLLIVSTFAFSGEQEGTGNTPEVTFYNGVYYLVICTPVAEQNENRSCVFVEVENNEGEN